MSSSVYRIDQIAKWIMEQNGCKTEAEIKEFFAQCDAQHEQYRGNFCRDAIDQYIGKDFSEWLTTHFVVHRGVNCGFCGTRIAMYVDVPTVRNESGYLVAEASVRNCRNCAVYVDETLADRYIDDVWDELAAYVETHWNPLPLVAHTLQ